MSHTELLLRVDSVCSSQVKNGFAPGLCRCMPALQCCFRAGVGIRSITSTTRIIAERCPAAGSPHSSPDLVVAAHRDCWCWRSHQSPRAHLAVATDHALFVQQRNAFREGLMMCVRWRFARVLYHIRSHGLRLLAWFRHRFLTLPSLLPRLASDHTE